MFEIFGIEMSIGWYIVVFFVCQLINVALNTIKTIIMYKEEKISSSLINAITYGFYAIIVVMTASALPLWLTIVITFITNLIGVYGSMWVLDRFKKDKLWEITATVDEEESRHLATMLDLNKIAYTELQASNNKVVFNIYSHNQKESAWIKFYLDSGNAKYIVHEERVRL